MDLKPNTYSLVLEVAPLEVGASYTVLPLHCTIMPRFLTRMSVDEVRELLAPVLNNQPPVLPVAGERQAFGPLQKLANVLEPSAELRDLHFKIYNLLNHANVRYTEKDWVGDGYIAHVSEQQDAIFEAGTQHISAALYLVEIEFPLDGIRRFVRHKFSLPELGAKA